MSNGEELAGILLKGSVTDAWDYIEKYNHLSNLEIYQDIITPAMIYVGQLWENFEITVADEHLASGVCDFILARLASKYKSKSEDHDAPKAMFLCLEGEQHNVGLKMTASLFEEKKWDVKFFGANLPVQYALKAAKEWEPDVIGLSVSIATHLPKLKEYTEVFTYLPKKPTILVGGRLTSMYNLQTFAANNPLIITNLYELNEWISNYQVEGRTNAIN
ncbi:cobalamin B12-binding domain-containing protein [Cytobacillus horneckiae]|uniref:cobalamin B12-binding domain-containing protein n=1 Tax=Cytobacillus horneckiae TaxID=549687 RepID=UPI003D9A6A11